MAELGMESTLAGLARRLFSETMAAWAYWAIIRPESTPGSGGEERGQAVGTGRVEEAVRPALGDRAKVGDTNGEEVEDVSDGRAVKVAVGGYRPVGQYDRVVDGRAQFTLGHCASMGDGVPDRARHLRSAPQRVRVLHPGVVRTVGGHDRRHPLQQCQEVGCARRLAGMRPQVVLQAR
jgi:hypothetical protein